MMKIDRTKNNVTNCGACIECYHKKTLPLIDYFFIKPSENNLNKCYCVLTNTEIPVSCLQGQEHFLSNCPLPNTE